MRRISAGLIACALAGSVACAGALAAVPEQAQEASPAQVAASVQPRAAGQELQQGWNGSKTRYFTDGVAAVGAKKIGGSWRAFNAKGTLQKKAFTMAKVTYYCTEKGVLEARKAGGTYYYANGREMSSADAREYKTLLAARGVLGKITKVSDS